MPEFHLLLISLQMGFKGCYLRLSIRNFRYVEVKLHRDTIITGTPYFKKQIPGHSGAFRWRERREIEDIFNPSCGKKENNLLIILYIYI